MQETQIELNIIKGKDYAETITITNSDGSAFDLTPYSGGRSTVRSNYCDDITGYLNVAFADITGGQLTLSQSGVAMTGWAAGSRMVADVELYTSGNLSELSVLPLIKVNVWPEVSKDY